MEERFILWAAEKDSVKNLATLADSAIKAKIVARALPPREEFMVVW